MNLSHLSLTARDQVAYSDQERSSEETRFHELASTLFHSAVNNKVYL